MIDAVRPYGLNILSEEIGWVDRGSAVTLAVDPVDGPGNALAGVPVCTFSAAVVVDGERHRYVDLVAALLYAEASGAAVGDVRGRPVEFDTDLSRRWSGIVAATPALLEALPRRWPPTYNPLLSPDYV